jgi:hypothetical protein
MGVFFSKMKKILAIKMRTFSVFLADEYSAKLSAKVKKYFESIGYFLLTT